MGFKTPKTMPCLNLAKNTSVVFQRTPCADVQALHTASGL